MINIKIAAATLVAGAAAATMIGFAGAAHAAPIAAAHPRAGMYGNPAAAARYWRVQHSNDCAEMSAADVVGQITRHEPTEQQIVSVAESIPSGYGPGPMYHPPGGTDPRNLPTLLAHYGIPSAVANTTTQGLERDLANGHKVIAIVNAETIWHGKTGGADHAVTVIGIDTRTGVVHLNDSGVKTGRDEKVSIATFDQAWITSLNEAVVTK